MALPLEIFNTAIDVISLYYSKKSEKLSHESNKLSQTALERAEEALDQSKQSHLMENKAEFDVGRNC